MNEMAMGIVNSSDFEKEVTSLIKDSTTQKSTIQKVIIPTLTPTNNKGRQTGSKEVPNELRKLIADTAITENRTAALQLANDFGISPSSVSAYSHGSTSTTSYDKQPNKATINNAKTRVSDRARKRLMMALNHITEAKLSNAKLRDVSGVARDMSAIMKNMDTNDNSLNSPKDGPTFVFYSPQIREEKTFEVIQSKD